jgi:hypothetical protein
LKVPAMVNVSPGLAPVTPVVPVKATGISKTVVPRGAGVERLRTPLYVPAPSPATEVIATPIVVGVITAAAGVRVNGMPTQLVVT